MKRAVIVARGNSGHQQSWGGAFGEGLKRRGWHVQLSPTADPCDLLVLWGTRRQADIARQKADGGEVCILERGYIGDRFAWTSVSFGGGLNGRGEFRGVSDDPGRFQRHFGELLQPWRAPGSGYALICGQVPGDMSIRHVDIEAFYRRSAKALQLCGWQDIRFRPHPKGGIARSGFGIPIAGGTLHEAFAAAGLVVTFNSNSGVDAVLAGVPTITMDEGAMAWPVAGHQVTEIVTPDRTAWAARLAWRQWRIEEISSGECMEAAGL